MQHERELWERFYQERADRWQPAASDFAREISRDIPPRCCLLDLGCGLAADAAFFVRAGHAVIAADLAVAALSHVRARYPAEERPMTVRLDMRSPLPIADAGVGAVYARLSLHYFIDAETRALFGEIRRVLRPGGVLAFMCKSTDDPLYGRGDPMEPDVFVLDGKMRHFFGEAYIRACLSGRFAIERMETGFEDLPGEPSRVLRVMARAAP